MMRETLRVCVHKSQGNRWVDGNGHDLDFRSTLSILVSLTQRFCPLLPSFFCLDFFSCVTYMKLVFCSCSSISTTSTLHCVCFVYSSLIFFSVLQVKRILNGKMFPFDLLLFFSPCSFHELWVLLRKFNTQEIINNSQKYKTTLDTVTIRNSLEKWINVKENMFSDKKRRQIQDIACLLIMRSY